jgi:RNase P/RNase MRP subunit p29
MEDVIESFKLQDWFAEKEGLVTGKIKGKIKHETKKAILIETKNGEQVWIPKSVIVEEKKDKKQKRLV